jgi:hypothetical protein
MNKWKVDIPPATPDELRLIAQLTAKPDFDRLDPSDLKLSIPMIGQG